LVYTSGTSFKGFESKYMPFETISFGEHLAVRRAKREPAQLRALSHTNLLRCYPGARRLRSSNFAPHDCWAAGFQLVALNLQTFDLPNQMHSALFSRNGGSGYVLKPPGLLEKRELQRVIKYKLNLQIISAQQLASVATTHESGGHQPPKDPKFRPHVSVQVFPPGIVISSAPKTKTRSIKGNAFSPIFDHDDSVIFHCSPDLLDLCFVEFAVHGTKERSDGVIGRCCIAVGSLLPGYRHLPLYDHFGTLLLFSSLFINSSLQQA